mgnify:FL=1
MGGSDIKFGATNLGGDQILLPEIVKRPSLTRQGPAKTASQMVDGIREVIAKLGADWAHIANISMTVPCPCTPEGAIIEATNLGTPETKSQWQLPFGDTLAAAVEEFSGIRIPVRAFNDANAAGQDDDVERFGVSTTRRSSVFITTGTGLGGCVMINGSVVVGVGQAGELGHVKCAIPAQYAARFAEETNPPCGCSGHQCVEARASLQGLIRRIGWALSDTGAAFIGADLQARGETLNPAVLAKLRDLHAQEPKLAAYNVRDLADDDQDPFCRWLLEDWAIVIGCLFANLAPVLHPNLFIIGGGLTEMSASAKDWFIDIVRRVYGEVNSQACFDSSESDCEITWSVSQDQGWRGAILMAIRAEQA